MPPPLNPRPMEFTPFPTVSPDIDPLDRASMVAAKDKYIFEELVRREEIMVLRDKAIWCVRREGPNARQNCRTLMMQYLEMLRGGLIRPFPRPEPRDGKYLQPVAASTFTEKFVQVPGEALHTQST